MPNEHRGGLEPQTRRVVAGAIWESFRENLGNSIRALSFDSLDGPVYIEGHVDMDALAIVILTRLTENGYELVPPSDDTREQANAND